MVFDSVDFDDHEDVVFVRDAKAGLRGIIGLHSTALGPALGGCRVLPYATEQEALTDVLRLSRGMTYKNALADLPLGGGKMVVIADAQRDKTPALLESVGRAVERLGGQYIVGQDIGTGIPDMDVIRRATVHVAGREMNAGGQGDPSTFTALGVFRGLEFVATQLLGKSSLAGLAVSIQGLGNVGWNLARRLHAEDVALVVTDVDQSKCARAAEVFDAQVVAPDEIYKAPVDVFAPCAKGAILNSRTIPVLACRAVSGGANNQLETAADGARLAARGIVYLPDYVVNSGGVQTSAAERFGWERKVIEQRIAKVSDVLAAVFALADKTGLLPGEAADQLAREKVAQAVPHKAAV